MTHGAASEQCPGCGTKTPALRGTADDRASPASLASIEGPTHRYIGASAACWAVYSRLLHAGEPPLAPAPLNALIVDAYAAQHPGVPSEQAIQSVAVHLLTLYGVLERGVASGNALWVRLRAVRQNGGSRRNRFHWLTPPSFEGSLTVSGIATSATPGTRAEAAQVYVRQVWSIWSQLHTPAITAWYDAYVLPDQL